MRVSVQIGTLDPYKKTYPLLIDSAVWKIVHLSIFGRNPRFEDASSQELEEKFKELEFKGARAFIIRRLSLKNYHSAELAASLKKREVSQGTIDSLLKEFSRLGYVNDSSWLASTIRVLRQQRYGYNAIKWKLSQKGIEEAEIVEAINRGKRLEDESNDECASIEKLLETRYRNRNLSDRKEKQKVVAGLARKGFKLDDIFSVLNAKSNSSY